MRRIYFLLPDMKVATAIVDELLLKRSRAFVAVTIDLHQMQRTPLCLFVTKYDDQASSAEKR